MSSSTTIKNAPAPAKLNLFLHILGRREDGYHTLQTVFHLLDYGDTLDFSLREDDKIHLLTPIEGVAEEDNLIVRAARLLQQHSSCQLGVDITCLKRLPMGGGLGGGSSDAATCLVALNQLWKTGYSLQQLAELGASLGADIPVFVLGQSAWAEGIGEQLTPLTLPETWYLVLAPDCPVSTAEVFNDPQLTRHSSAITIAAFFEGGGRNDCQPVVSKRYPAVQQALDWLGDFSPGQLTGTGAAVFASFPDESSARAVLAQLPKTLDGQAVSGFVAKGVNQSPLHQQYLS